MRHWWNTRITFIGGLSRIPVETTKGRLFVAQCTWAGFIVAVVLIRCWIVGER